MPFSATTIPDVSQPEAPPSPSHSSPTFAPRAVSSRRGEEDARKAFFDALAPRRDRDVRRHGVYYTDRVRWLRALIPLDASILDVGCGIGTVLRQLPQRDRTGIDFSPAMIVRAREQDPAGTYAAVDIVAFAPSRTYDYVLFLDTVNYLEDVQAALWQVRTQLAHDRTRLILTFYNFLWSPLLRLGEMAGWKTRFPAMNWLGRADLQNLLRLTDFDVIETGGRVLLPIGIPILSSLCNRYLASLPVLRHLCFVQYIIARPVSRPTRNFSVIVLSAVRNERGNIARIAATMPAMGSTTELLFIEGHSSDGTWEEIQRVARAQRGPVSVRGIQQSGKGKADALHCGIAASTGDILLIYDGDFTVHPGDLPKVYAALAEGKAEFVNASRLVYPLQDGAMPMLNLLGNHLFSRLFRWLFAQHIRDPLSPVKGFFRRDGARMTARADPFGDFDFFLGAAMQQLHIREVPVRYHPRSYGATKLKPFAHGWLLLRMFFRGAKVLRWI